MKTGKSIFWGVLFSCMACLFGMASCDSQPTEEKAQAALEKKGGMVVTLAPDMPGMLYDLSDHNQSEDFKEALEAAKSCTIKDDYLSTFIYVYNVLSGPRLSLAFCTYELRDRITYSSSNQEVEAVLREIIETKINNAAVVLQARLDRFGAKKAFVKITDDNKIIAIIPEVQDLARVRRLLQANGRLEFWETYEAAEVMPGLVQLNSKYAADVPQQELGEEALTFEDIESEGTSLIYSDEMIADYKKRNPFFAILNPRVSTDGETMRGPVVGFVNETDTAQVKVMLTSAVAKTFLPRDVRFIWTSKPIGEDNPYYELIALKAQRDGRAVMSGYFITNAKVEHNKWSPDPVVDISMTTEGSKRWQNVTRNNIGKSIAIVVDGLVYSYPVVQCEIEGGHSQITGNFTEEEAADMANLLNSGVMPCPLRIIEEQIIEPQK